VGDPLELELQHTGSAVVADVFESRKHIKRGFSDLLFLNSTGWYPEIFSRGSARRIKQLDVDFAVPARQNKRQCFHRNLANVVLRGAS
jgi:hypothetical protein